MDKHALTTYLAALDDTEFAELVAEARGAGHRQDIKSLIERELQKPASLDDAARKAEAAGDWERSIAIKTRKMYDH